MTTLDPKKHTAVTFPIKNHKNVCNSLNLPRQQGPTNFDQQLPSTQLDDLPDDKDESDTNPLATYAGDPKLDLNTEVEASMFDDENSIVHETPGMHGEEDLVLHV